MNRYPQIAEVAFSLKEIYISDTCAELINTYKEQIVNIFITLKQNNQLNKENMCKNLSSIIDISNTKGKIR